MLRRKRVPFESGVCCHEAEQLTRVALLQPLDDAAAALAALPPGLEAADWLEAVRALNTLRRLAVRHPDACAPQL